MTRPDVSILLTHPAGSAGLIESLRAQRGCAWELVIVAPAQTVSGTEEVAGNQVCRVDCADKDSDGSRSAAALRACRGDVVVRINPGEEFTPGALRAVRRVFRHDAEVDMVYGDREVVSGDIARSVDARPEWSPERLRWQNYLTGPVFMRASRIEAVGSWRETAGGSIDYDMVLRIGEQARRVVRVPKVLSSGPRFEVEDSMADGDRAVVREHLDRIGVRAEVVTDGVGHALRRTLPPSRRVSVVIPTAGSSATVSGRTRVMVVESVRSLIAHTTHRDLEIVVVADESMASEVREELAAMCGDRLTLVFYREPFNFSRKVNLGSLVAGGDRLVLLNDDTEVLTARWLDELVGLLEEPDVGVTGARLLYDDGLVQHVGLASVPEGGYLHSHLRAAAESVGDFGELGVNREVSAVTGACLAVRREVFLELGGLTEELPASYNDVDFCLKARRSGYRVVLARNCELLHFESMTRVPRVEQWEMDRFLGRWGPERRDPYMAFVPREASSGPAAQRGGA